MAQLTIDVVEYLEGSSLDDLAIEWRNSARQIIDFSVGHSFSAELWDEGEEIPLLIKLNGFVGFSTKPNVVVSWVAGELDSLLPGTYFLVVVATRVVDMKARPAKIEIRILPRNF